MENFMKLDVPDLKKNFKHNIDVVIDRLLLIMISNLDLLIVLN